MNILYIYSSNIIPNHGGVQRVTQVLCDYFRLNGHTCYYLSTQYSDDEIEWQYILPYNELMHPGNIQYLQAFLSDKQIDVVVNQDGLNRKLFKFIIKSCFQKVIIISVAHNSLLSSVVNFCAVKFPVFKKYNVAWMMPVFEMKLVKKILFGMYFLKYRRHFYNVLKFSDKFVLLSKGLEKELSFFCPHFPSQKVLSIPNPCTLICKEGDRVSKEKEVLFVGRISFGQKRVDLLLQIWKKIEPLYSDWKLKIVGDGEDLSKLTQMSKELNLKRVFFEGFQTPANYYKNASLLCLTSAYEGFPLVLCEAMTYGTVPVAFDSYVAAKDIIDNEINGLLIPPFDTEIFAEKLSSLMSDKRRLATLSSGAKEKAYKYSIDVIGKEWIALFNK